MTKARPRSVVAVMCGVACLATAHNARANEIWVAPTLQSDVGGLGVASNIVWPVTPAGAVRFAWGVPGDLQAFQSARVVLIPHAPGGAATLNIVVCGAKNGDPATGNCAGPFAQAFTGVPNQVQEVAITAIVGPHVGAAGQTHLALLAYTTPTTASDRIVGLRFAYAAAAPTITGTATINGGNLDLDGSTAAAGNLTKNGVRFLHNYGTNNTFLGAAAGNFTMSGGSDTAVGDQALSANTSGNYNTATGTRALRANTNGSSNTALGADALSDNTSGGGNTAVGTAALTSNMVGNSNTAVGASALGSITNEFGNTAIGANALAFSSASENTATGVNTLFSNLSGTRNTGTGSRALLSNRTGQENTATGHLALSQNTSGNHNSAVGAYAMLENTIGAFNVAAGLYALADNISGSSNVAIGHDAGRFLTTGDDNIYLGMSVVAESGGSESGTIRIGNGFQTKTFIAGIRNRPTGVANAVPVLIDSNGQLGTASSSARVKEEIHDMAGASRRLFDLRPVTFRYKEAYADGSKPIQFGLIAEEVAVAFPELAVRGADGEVETVHYETLSVLLLNEVRRQEQEARRLAGKIEWLQERLDALARQLADLHRRRP